MKVLAALSGGVDSAVAAARALAAGHEVTAVHLALAQAEAPAGGRGRGCCTPADARDARRVADVLGLPFYVWDLADRFAADVVADFVAEYAAGHTPNPCVRCNERIKFAAVLDRAVALGFDAVVTGHYARLDGGRLRRAVDAAKDQSYVLAVLDARQLAHALFPLGDARKDEVRAQARRLGLGVADKPDSHDICFIPDGDVARFLRGHLPARPARIVDAAGATLGTADSVYGWTVGQRRGLRLDRPAADGAPRYVTDVAPAGATLTVGPAAALEAREVRTGAPGWCGGAPPPLPVRCHVQLRAHGEAVPATVDGGADGLTARLDRPLRAVAPGQSMVLYDGDVVLGHARVRR